MDLDFWDCFGKDKTLSYSQRNMVCKSVILVLLCFLPPSKNRAKNIYLSYIDLDFWGFEGKKCKLALQRHTSIIVHVILTVLRVIIFDILCVRFEKVGLYSFCLSICYLFYIWIVPPIKVKDGYSETLRWTSGYTVLIFILL